MQYSIPMLLEMKKEINNLQKKPKDNFNRMAFIRRIQQYKGLLLQDAIKFLDRVHRSRTNKMYGNGWNSWVNWCKQHGINFEEYNIQHILTFLIDHQHVSHQHLKTIKLSIPSDFKYAHQQKEPIIALQRLIQDFFSSKRNQPVKVPEITK